MCPDREILSVHADGEIGAPWGAAVDAHVASCATCRAVLDRIKETRRILLEASTPDWIAPMERVRQRVLSLEAAPRSPIWRRSLELPVPLAALAAALLLFLGLAVALLALRVDIGLLRVTKAPSGAIEYQFGVPMDQFDEILKSMGADDSAAEEVIALPKNVKLVPAREPVIGKETELLRQKQ